MDEQQTLIKIEQISNGSDDINKNILQQTEQMNTYFPKTIESRCRELFETNLLLMQELRRCNTERDQFEKERNYYQQQMEHYKPYKDLYLNLQNQIMHQSIIQLSNNNISNAYLGGIIADTNNAIDSSKNDTNSSNKTLDDMLSIHTVNIIKQENENKPKTENITPYNHNIMEQNNDTKTEDITADYLYNISPTATMNKKNDKNAFYEDSDEEIKRFGCCYCGKRFNLKQNLKVHIRVHTGERPFKCKYCPKRFKDSRARINHHLTHTGEKPHECSICNKRFGQSSSYNRHLRSQTHKEKIRKLSSTDIIKVDQS